MLPIATLSLPIASPPFIHFVTNCCPVVPLSEHAFGGGFYDGELHLVHKSADGKLLVLGVIFEADDGVIASGNSQSMLSVMWHSAADAYKTTTGAAASQVSARATMYEWDVSNAAGPVDFYRGFLPPSRAYWTYTGSLTTYPCTEGVTWIVMEQPVRISQIDLMILRSAVRLNPNTIIDGTTNNDNRPTQPLKGRTIRRYSGIDPLPTMAPAIVPPTTAAPTTVSGTTAAPTVVAGTALATPTVAPVSTPAASATTTVAPTPLPSVTPNNNVVAVAAALANSGPIIQSELAALYPGIVVSNPTVSTRLVLPLHICTVFSMVSTVFMLLVLSLYIVTTVSIYC